jgi:hypothetical protein
VRSFQTFCDILVGDVWSIYVRVMATRGLFSVSNVTPLPINGAHINTVLTQLSSDPTAVIDTSDQLLLFPMAQQPVGQGLLITPQSVGFLRTSDQPNPETSTWQHTTLATVRHAPSGIGTRNASKRADANPRLRQHDRWDRLAFT